MDQKISSGQDGVMDQAISAGGDNGIDQAVSSGGYDRMDQVKLAGGDDGIDRNTDEEASTDLGRVRESSPLDASFTGWTRRPRGFYRDGLGKGTISIRCELRRWIG